MTRYYIFEWYEKTTNWGKGYIIRHNRINIPNPTGKVEVDAKKAVEYFIRGFGNLKQNTILSIKEFDENGQIGEDIIPATENVIVPVKK
jgi:hypothetical protein